MRTCRPRPTSMTRNRGRTDADGTDADQTYAGQHDDKAGA